MDALEELVGGLDCEGVKFESSKEEETPCKEEESLDMHEEKRRKKRELKAWRQLIKESEMITPSSSGLLRYDAGKIAQYPSRPSPVFKPTEEAETPDDEEKPLDMRENKRRKKRELEAWRQSIKESDCEEGGVSLAAEKLESTEADETPYEVEKPLHTHEDELRRKQELKAWRQLIKESEMITPSSSGLLLYDAGKFTRPVCPPSPKVLS